MKKIVMAIVLFTMMIPVKSFAGITDSFWFEPGLLCAAGGIGGYVAAPKGSEAQTAVIGCVVGGLIGYLLNDHYKEKFTRSQQAEIDDLNRVIKEIQAQQAQKILNGEDETVGLRVKQIVPGQRLPDGSVTAPTIREKLILPGEGTRIGE